MFVADPEDPLNEEPVFVSIESEIDDLLIFVGCSNELTSSFWGRSKWERFDPRSVGPSFSADRGWPRT